MTLPVVNAANRVLVVMFGEDKAEAFKTGVLKEKTIDEFPACGVKKSALWLTDTGAASLIPKDFINHYKLTPREESTEF